MEQPRAGPWSESDLVRAARLGDRAAFGALAAAHRDRVRLHCYRMLGSFHDADDAVQETLIKAWRNIARFGHHSALGTWLHQIATNTCLNMIRARPRTVVPEGFTDRHRPAFVDVPWLEPYPDVHLPAPRSEEPEARIEPKEATRLAFVATMQLLPARQRAVLLLRDVLVWSAAEVAEALHTTVPAVNSALQRARARLAEHRTWDDATTETEQTIDEFVRLWEACDTSQGLPGLAHEPARADHATSRKTRGTRLPQRVGGATRRLGTAGAAWAEELPVTSGPRGHPTRHQPEAHSTHPRSHHDTSA